MIIVRTPLRLSFVGGGSDMPSFYQQEDGMVISTAIDKYVYVIVKERFDEKIYINYSRKECVDEVEQIQHDLVREAMKISGVERGVEITTLTGADEARLTFLAVRRWFGWSSGRLIVFDIGGGSLEIAVGADEEPDGAISLPLGAGRLTRERLVGDPPTAASVRELRRHVRAEIAGEVGRIQRSGVPRRAVATSKTFRQLARIAGAAPSGEGDLLSVEIEVRDTGPGIPPGERTRVFEPFEKASSSPCFSQPGQGDHSCGLGLTLTSGFVRLLGGKIDLESTEGEGSTFRVRVPAKAVERPVY